MAPPPISIASFRQRHQKLVENILSKSSFRWLRAREGLSHGAEKRERPFMRNFSPLKLNI